MITKRIIAMVALAVFVFVPISTRALTTDEIQQQIQSLLTQVQTLQAQIAALSAQQNSSVSPSSGATTGQANCFSPTRTLSFGMSGSDVSALQSFLASAGYFKEAATGYFGSVTEAAVQQWQTAHGVVSSGGAASTGFGVVGSQTRAAMSLSCLAGSSTSPSIPTSPSSGSSVSCPAIARSCPTGSHDQLGDNCSHTCVSDSISAVSGIQTSSGSSSSVPSSGASCTTPWGSQKIADGSAISYQPYFSNGAIVPSAAIYVMKCSNGTWLQCNAQSENCQAYTTPQASSQATSYASNLAVGASCVAYQTTYPDGSTTSCTVQPGPGVGCPVGLPFSTWKCSNGQWQVQGTQTSSPSSNSAQSCTFNDQTVASGNSVTAYAASSVPSGSSCVSQTRTCSNGTLSGSYQYSSCAVASASTITNASCTDIYGNTVSSGQTGSAGCPGVLAFMCVQTQLCQNGTWVSTTQTSAAPLSCAFNSQTISSGSTVTAYQASSVAYGSSCASQTRTCTNGTLSGSYQYPSCSVASAPATSSSGASCVLNNATYSSGQSLSYSTWLHEEYPAGIPMGLLFPNPAPTLETCNNGQWIAS